MSNSLTERRAERLLTESDSLKVPVAVEKVARHLGLIVQARPLGDASGVLVVESGRGVIGYNANHSQVRQRFTIAHEVGHFVLHAAGQQQRLFVDKSVFRRDEASSRGDDREEIEANQFAAALLMPEMLLRAEIERLGLDLDDEVDVGELARRFAVSTAAMSFRLENLRIIRGSM